MLIPAAAALALWLVVLALPWRPWGCAERLEPDADADVGAAFADLTVVMPARDEAAVIGLTLGALAREAPDVPVIVIDDQSSDATAAVARASALRNLTVLHGTPPPENWTGKLWALEQGLAHATTGRVLLLDADIQLAPGMLAALVRKADAGFALVSVCAEPCWQGRAARWLMPAFVYFFKLLYPFALANRRGSRVAAAAGGVILIERAALARVGGFPAWRDAIIDDCTLAARVKGAGHACFIGLSHGATSLRAASLGGIVHMVARTAFVQLRESWTLLGVASLALVVAFCVPVLAVCVGPAEVRVLGALAWFLLAACYVPILRYYRRSVVAALLLPLAAAGFLAMTWFSALRAAGGTRSQWKGRRYRRRAR